MSRTNRIAAVAAERIAKSVRQRTMTSAKARRLAALAIAIEQSAPRAMPGQIVHIPAALIAEIRKVLEDKE